MNNDNWIPIDKNLSQDFELIKKPFSRIEAMFSVAYNQNERIQESISGYASLWGWSRNRVRHFLNCIQGKGHVTDKKRIGREQPVYYIDKFYIVKRYLR